MTKPHGCDIVRQNQWGGFPAEYLTARVKGRQSSLIAGWERTAALTSGLSDEQIWRALLHELRWLHRQMAPELLRATAPLFGLFELKTIVLALRCLAIGRLSVMRTLVGQSLLDDAIQRELRQARDVPTALGRLAAIDAPHAAIFAELPDAYRRGRLRAVEDALVKRFLECVSTAPLAPVMRAFFASFIDMRNLVMTYKQLRWEVREPGLLIAGGRLDRRRLTGIVDRRDTAALIAVAQRVAGRRVPVVASDAALEALLLRTITSALARYRRDEQPVPVLVSYMWRRYIEARNLALLLHATDVEAAALERELIA